MSEPVWKMIYLARRNPTLAAEDFPQAWREHSALGRRCRNVQDKVLGVTQCSRVLEGDGIAGCSTDYDGVNLLRLRDLQAASDIWHDPETLAIMRPDEPRVFSTYVRDCALVCREHVVREAAAGGVCVLAFLRRRAGVSRADFDANGLAAVWLGAPASRSAQRMVLNAVVQPPPSGYDYDAIAEWWFESVSVARAAFFGRSAGRDLREQLPALFEARVDLARSVFLFTQVSHRRP